jgi:hypothetical protein
LSRETAPSVLTRRQRERLQDKRLIFFATTGRSGTKFAARAMRSIEGMDAFWETDPNFAWVVRPSRKQQGVAKRWWVNQKLPAILSGDNEGQVYAETSHYLTQGALGAALALDIPFDLVVLTRDVRETAVSFWRRQSIPLAKTDKLWPTDPGMHVKVDSDGLNEYQLVFWWILEMRHRMWLYAEETRKRGRIVAAVSLPEVATKGGFDLLRTTLGLPEPDWDRFPLLPINASDNSMLALYPPGDLGAQEAEVLRRAGLPFIPAI